MLIFVHIPKTGGTSISSQFVERNNARYLSDYDDRNLSEELEFVERRNKNKRSLVADDIARRFDLIFGHVRADKYDCLRGKVDVKLFTIMREPVSRTVSHYFFLKDYISRNLFPDEIYRAHPELRDLRENRLDLVSFAGLDKYKNIYSNYFSGKSIDNFAFIGMTEHYSKSIGVMNKLFNLSLSVRHIHTSPSPAVDELRAIAPELRKLNESNQYFYRMALDRFLSRW